MMQQKILSRISMAIVVIVMFIFSLATTGLTASAALKELAAGSTWTVNKTTSLSRLAIAEGAVLNAPEGYSVTMTVDGVETPIKPGAYKGEIVLTISEKIVVEYRDKTYVLRPAIDIENGAYAAEKSVPAAVMSGTVSNTRAKDIKIVSVGDGFNGILVRSSDSDSTPFSYTIDNPEINLTGNGGTSDFVGVGAAIVSSGYSDVTLNNASIVTRGIVRTAVVVNGNSTLHVNDSYIEANNGIMPKEITEPWNGSKEHGMISVPFMLGLVGNNRATNLTDNGIVFYDNTHIKAQAWGCLSTDQGGRGLNATDCHIEVVESGYGAYADGIDDTFSGCLFDVPDYGLIMTGGSGVFTDKCVVNSGRFGVMMHGHGGNLTIEKGSVFNTGEAVIQLKGSFPTIIVDSAKLNSESGVILQAMVNDDPDMAKQKGGIPGGGAPDAGGAPGRDAGMPQGSGMQGGGMPGGPGGGSSEVNATFRNMTIDGDIVSSATTLGDVIVNFEKATITGAITTSTVQHALGPNGEELTYDTPELYYLIGKVKDTYCATDDKYGVEVSLDKNSKWIVEKTSYLTGLSISKGAVVTAPKGCKLTMTVDGVAKSIGAGVFEGRIVLLVTKL